jgi:hypothetical protein
VNDRGSVGGYLVLDSQRQGSVSTLLRDWGLLLEGTGVGEEFRAQRVGGSCPPPTVPALPGCAIPAQVARDRLASHMCAVSADDLPTPGHLPSMQ